MESENGQGGRGALLAPDDPASVAADLELIRKAVKAGWDVPESERAAIVSAVTAIAQNEAHPHCVRAAGVLRAMTADHQSDVQMVFRTVKGTDAAPNTTNILILNIPPPRALEAVEFRPLP